MPSQFAQGDLHTDEKSLQVRPRCEPCLPFALGAAFQVSCSATNALHSWPMVQFLHLLKCPCAADVRAGGEYILFQTSMLNEL